VFAPTASGSSRCDCGLSASVAVVGNAGDQLWTAGQQISKTVQQNLPIRVSSTRPSKRTAPTGGSSTSTRSIFSAAGLPADWPTQVVGRHPLPWSEAEDAVRGRPSRSRPATPMGEPLRRQGCLALLAGTGHRCSTRPRRSGRAPLRNPPLSATSTVKITRGASATRTAAGPSGRDQSFAEFSNGKTACSSRATTSGVRSAAATSRRPLQHDGDARPHTTVGYAPLTGREAGSGVNGHDFVSVFRRYRGVT